MKHKQLNHLAGLILISLACWGCVGPQPTIRPENRKVPERYYAAGDTTNAAKLNWRKYFGDAQLAALIDTALANNQELNILTQEIEISRNEIMARKGEYLPFVRGGAGAGVEKPGRYTPSGAVEDQLDVKPGKPFPEPLQDYGFGATASWEIDIWRKLRNAKQSAALRYLGSIEGRNFMVTNLIAEIAESYYTLMALDNQLVIIEQNIEIQTNALNVVKQQKAAAKVTQLAVNRFEAQLLNTQNLQYVIRQRITETENHINFLTGRFPSPITRNSAAFLDLETDSVQSGVPSQLLTNRPDIRQAEFGLQAARLDVKVARAEFYPSVGIRAGVGFQAFNPRFLISPESILFNLAGDMVAPLVNRNAIRAGYLNANARQVQAIYMYEQTILSAHVDVLNQLAKMDNYTRSYDTKRQQVDILVQSVTIAGNLFTSARADYAEVLFTQREALESKMDLIEIKQELLGAKVNLYRALGGGWQ